MPIYDYRCSDCSHQLEALQKLSDALLTTCPECGKETLRKQVSAPAFRLAGSGWYETDFKTGNQKNLAGDGKEKNSSGEASGAVKSESGSKTGSSDASGTSGAGKKSSGQSDNTTAK
ncbi:MAG: zinc ribbon domain-containing protein [Luminiphilus sp.]|nr:zinc ribbon domain-containing protein [Luminiphilus sp.]MDG1460433.1 zinc ribbon domain-containing protein [Luminiphilus sp.]